MRRLLHVRGLRARTYGPSGTPVGVVVDGGDDQLEECRGSHRNRRGILAGSIALVGFGLDTIAEVASAVVIVWRLSQRTANQLAQERAERRAVRLVALTSRGGSSSPPRNLARST
jgi:hypothetical protein